MTSVQETPSPASSLPVLWCEPAPQHFDTSIPWWIKMLVIIISVIVAILFLDQPIAHWALQTHPIPDLLNDKARHGDVARELMMLEQWGQWVSSVLVIVAVAMIDSRGRRKALSIAIGCLVTVLVTYLLKDLFGRTRPYVAGDGSWIWGGPAHGFVGGSRWTSFPSAHTTGAFALAVGLAWYYPRARMFFMMLASITAVQRVLHSAHFLSDVIAGMGLSVGVARMTLKAKLAGRLLMVLPAPLQQWFAQESPSDRT